MRACRFGKEVSALSFKPACSYFQLNENVGISFLRRKSPCGDKKFFSISRNYFLPCRGNFSFWGYTERACAVNICVMIHTYLWFRPYVWNTITSFTLEHSRVHFSLYPLCFCFIIILRSGFWSVSDRLHCDTCVN